MAVQRRVANIAVIGCGRWGPNHVRVFSELDRSHVICCADPNPARLEGVSKRFPHVQTVSDYRSCLDSLEVGVDGLVGVLAALGPAVPDR